MRDEQFYKALCSVILLEFRKLEYIFEDAIAFKDDILSYRVQMRG